MTHILDKNRRDFNLIRPLVDEALPSYFAQEYGEDSGSLIKLLDKYYQFLDSSGVNSFGGDIKSLYSVRDISETNSKGLDQLISEIGNGLTASSFFQQPRLMARLLGQFYRSKGTLVSAEGFFRGFFNEEVDIEYPKDQIFIVGESNIGFEDQKFIQDNAIFQVFSILVKSGLSVGDYINLYKKFVHPAGFHIAGELTTTTGVNAGLTAGTTTDPLATDEDLTVGSSASLTVQSLPTAMTVFFNNNNKERARVDQPISDFGAITLTKMADFYQSVRAVVTPNSFTFDDSSLRDSNLAAGPDFSLTVETMDNAMFDSSDAETLII